ncbi:hypothetical protein QTP86_025138 [Hemibagrus guttatus]|nr:hypothetical protein QTP86_025138 [Hemibagrus guttatus]
MGLCGYVVVPWRCLAVLALRLLFLVPAGVPARSGDSYLKDNITVRQGDSAVLKFARVFWRDFQFLDTMMTEKLLPWGRCPTCCQRRRVSAAPCSRPPAPWGVLDPSETDIVAPEPSFVGGRRSGRVLGGGRRSKLLLGGGRRSKLLLGGGRRSKLLLGGGRRLVLRLGCGRHSALRLGCGRHSALRLGCGPRSAPPLGCGRRVGPFGLAVGCNVDSKVSRVAWLNRTTILFTGSEKWSLDPRVVLLNNTSVTEYSIKILDVNLHDEGPYVCSILTNKKPESTKVHLVVQVPARIVNISTDITVNEGSNISLMCLAIGRPEPSIIWKYRSARGRRFISEGEYVEMTAITKEQSGSYECISSNDISPPDVRTVQVTVNYPPVISQARSTGTAVGQRGVLQCEASAVPLADFQWYKEERRLSNGLNGVKIENKGKQSMLIFFNVSEEDYGNYTCVAMNTLGITNASIILYGKEIFNNINRFIFSYCLVS